MIYKAYGRKYKLGPPDVTLNRNYRRPAGLHYHLQSNPVVGLMKKNWFPLAFLLFVLIHVIMAIYYYNLLVDTEQNMNAASANVEALLQRRNDIAHNLSKAVLDYAGHEQQVLASVVSLRTFMSAGEPNQEEKLKELSALIDKGKQAVAADGGAGAAASGNDLLSSLSSLVAIAEQYPNLKLSTNFESLMAALVEVEKDLAAERIKFNNEANIYTTNVVKFPCNIFAYIFGFETRPYFDSTMEAKNFKRIEY